MNDLPQPSRRLSTPLDPVARVVAFDWMRQAVEEGEPLGVCECWRCGQWRPDAGNNENGDCPHCGASYLAF